MSNNEGGNPPPLFDLAALTQMHEASAAMAPPPAQEEKKRSPRRKTNDAGGEQPVATSSGAAASAQPPVPWMTQGSDKPSSRAAAHETETQPQLGSLPAADEQNALPPAAAPQPAGEVVDMAAERRARRQDAPAPSAEVTSSPVAMPPPVNRSLKAPPGAQPQAEVSALVVAPPTVAAAHSATPSGRAGRALNGQEAEAALRAATTPAPSASALSEQAPEWQGIDAFNAGLSGSPAIASPVKPQTGWKAKLNALTGRRAQAPAAQSASAATAQQTNPFPYASAAVIGVLMLAALWAVLQQGKSNQIVAKQASRPAAQAPSTSPAREVPVTAVAQPVPVPAQPASLPASGDARYEAMLRQVQGMGGEEPKPTPLPQAATPMPTPTATAGPGEVMLATVRPAQPERRRAAVPVVIEGSDAATSAASPWGMGQASAQSPATRSMALPLPPLLEVARLGSPQPLDYAVTDVAPEATGYAAWVTHSKTGTSAWVRPGDQLMGGFFVVQIKPPSAVLVQTPGGGLAALPVGSQ